jgi:hypothetical protein
MRRIAVLAVVFLSALWAASAEVPLLYPEAEAVHVFPIGRGEGELGLGPEGTETWAPSDLAMSADELLWVADYRSSRVVGFDIATFAVSATVRLDFGPERVSASENALAVWTISPSVEEFAYAFRVQSAAGGPDDWVGGTIPLPVPREAYFFFSLPSLVVGLYSEDGLHYFAVKPGTGPDEAEYVPEEEFRQMVAERSPEIQAADLSFDRRWLVSGDQTVALGSSVVTRYDTAGRLSLTDGSTYAPAGGFIGVDADANHYVSERNRFTVYSHHGDAIAVIDVNEFHKTSIRGTVDSRGNIYFMSSSPETGHVLYRVRNTWAPIGTRQSESDGLSTAPLSEPPDEVDSLMRGRLVAPDKLAAAEIGLRSAATIGLPAFAYVSSDSEVRVLDQSEPQQIGILSAPWYLVATADGTEGWVYGAFLEMAE